MKKIIVGTRGSKLAVTQTKQAIKQLQNQVEDLEVELKIIKTKGDKLANHSLQAIGGQGAFVKEIEIQLRNHEIDLAIHSLKDVPTVIPADLTIGCVLKRVNPYDCLIFSEPGQSLMTLPTGAKVGTSSLRRQAQLLEQRPDLQIVPLRGNIDTRLKKLQTPNYDAIVLALAGLKRLALLDESLTYEELDETLCLPAIGQGALALECRKEDQEVLHLLQKNDDLETRLCIEAEREFLRNMDGSCTFPIGAFAKMNKESIELAGMVAGVKGTPMIKHQVIAKNPVVAGQKLAEIMKDEGADLLIKECKENAQKSAIHPPKSLF